jgi:enhancing lycopene biosynthesis protein 2
MAKRVGVILSGCGVFDGSEIHEAVLTLLYLDRAGVEIVCMAPDIPQAQVINHLTGEEMGESRNVLLESARIARGEIKALEDAKAEELDGLFMPGGFGSAKNLSEFAFKGAEGAVNPDVKRILEEMLAAGKPVGACCIAPATVGMALKGHMPQVTVGNDETVAGALTSLGVKHETCGVNDISVDRKNKIVSTPAYMLGPGIKDIAVGIEKAVKELVAMM